MTTQSVSMNSMKRSFCGPQYVWETAIKVAEMASDSHCCEQGPLMRRAVSYLRRRRRGGDQTAEKEFPMIAAACNLAKDEHQFHSLKLMILGAIPRGEIAARLGVELGVVEIAESLFFDIREFKDAAGWMHAHVFYPTLQADQKELGVELKLAYFGGPFIVRALLDAKEGLPLEEAKQVLDQEVLLHTKLQAALEFELSAQTSVRFVEMFLKYDLAKRKLEFQREKFRHRCEAVNKDLAAVQEQPEKEAAEEHDPLPKTEKPHVA